ncbi:hypothetical protein ACOMHN_003646 [Nucella lapillus]
MLTEIRRPNEPRHVSTILCKLLPSLLALPSICFHELHREDVTRSVSATVQSPLSSSTLNVHRFKDQHHWSRVRKYSTMSPENNHRATKREIDPSEGQGRHEEGKRGPQWTTLDPTLDPTLQTHSNARLFLPKRPTVDNT